MCVEASRCEAEVEAELGVTEGSDLRLLSQSSRVLALGQSGF